jgi:hypothetical protein
MGRIEPPTHGFSVREQTPENQGKTQISGDAGANAGAVETKKVPTLADVRAVVEACPDLPEAIKAGILAMVKAAGPRP